MEILTTGTIAKRLDTDRDAVAYAIRKMRIQPVGCAGIVRLFPETAIETVREFLQHKRRNRVEVEQCTA